MIFQVDVPIFETSIVCCHSCDASDAMDEFYHWKDKRSRIELPEEDTKHGCVVSYKGDVFVWIKNPTEYYRFVFHELVHVFHSICKLKGITNIDEEFESYFMGWLKQNVSDTIMDHLDFQAIANIPVPVPEQVETPIKKPLKYRRKRS